MPLLTVATTVEASLVLKSTVMVVPALALAWLTVGAPLPDAALMPGGVLSVCSVYTDDVFAALPSPGVTVAVKSCGPSSTAVVSTSKVNSGGLEVFGAKVLLPVTRATPAMPEDERAVTLISTVWRTISVAPWPSTPTMLTDTADEGVPVVHFPAAHTG